MINNIKDTMIIFALIVLMFGMIKAITNQDKYYTAQKTTLDKVITISDILKTADLSCN